MAAIYVPQEAPSGFENTNMLESSVRQLHCVIFRSIFVGETAMILQDKVAIVTGGDSGIGRAIVLGLAQAGATVTINYHRNHDAAEQVKRHVEQSNGKALIVQGNVGSVADVQKLVDQTVETFGRLDIMINNSTRVRWMIPSKKLRWSRPFQLSFCMRFFRAERGKTAYD